tara:strand:+ start:13287 stop:14144 length:858 start_codon:yes stop_codon:yes gene_type:complete
MKLEIDFSALDALIERLGAKPTVWSADTGRLSGRDRLLKDLGDGIAIEIEKVAPRGILLEYEGEQVLLYIKDTKSALNTLLHEPEHSRRFHLAECRTIERMRRDKRFERYHVTRRIDGKFKCSWIDFDSREEGEVEAELKVCKDCLKAVNWEEYNDDPNRREEIWSRFDIPDFLREYESVFYNTPSRDDEVAVSARYQKDWPGISKRYRSSRNWICESCGVSLEKNRKLLHTHHISGDLMDNSPLNLQALCVLCHAQQPLHGRLKCTPAEKALIMRLRHQQSLGS